MKSSKQNVSFGISACEEFLADTCKYVDDLAEELKITPDPIRRNEILEEMINTFLSIRIFKNLRETVEDFSEL